MALIGHYRLNDASGTTATATVGSDGSYVNAPTLGSWGPGGTSYIGVQVAAASSHSITLPNQAITDPWTVTLYFATTETDVVLLDFTDGTDDGLSIELVSGSIVVRVNGADHTSASTQNDGLYHHVAVSYSTEVATIYIDGAADGSTLAATDLAVSAGVTLGSGLDGNLSEVRFYDDAQDAAGVLAIYNASQGPVLHYNLDQTTGTIATDSSGNNLNGTLVGTTFDAASGTDNPGALTRSLDLSGLAGYVNSPTNQATLPLAGFNAPISISAWIKLNQTPGTVDDHIAYDNANAGIRCYVASNGRIYFYLYGVSGNNVRTTSASALSANTWHLLTFTWDANDSALATGLKTYIDGSEVASYIASANGFDVFKIPGTSFPIAFGKSSNTAGIDGKIDDCRFYYRELSSSEVAALYDAGVGSGTAPTITTTSPLNFTENSTAAIVIEHTGDPTPTLAITGGADAAKFSLAGNNLSFVTPPDYENPTDADTSNDYVVELTSTNSEGTDVLTLTVNVTDAAGPTNTVAPVISKVS